MRTKEEIYEEYECSKRRDILDAMEAYATEAIKADRERVKRAIRYPLGFIDGKISNEERIDNLPIELK